MRRYIIILFIYFTESAIVFSQDNSFGLLLGLSGAQISGDGYSGYNKPGLDAGIFLRHSLNENWHLQSELKYIMKGDATSSVVSGYTDATRTSLEYFEIPFLATRAISKNFEVELGLAAAYLINATETTTSLGSQSYSTGKYDISAIGGITYLYNEQLSFNIKISYSLKPIDNLAGYITWQGNYGRYNNVIELAVYYTITTSQPQRVNNDPDN